MAEEVELEMEDCGREGRGVEMGNKALHGHK